MCFYRNKPLRLDCGYGPEPKITSLGASSSELVSVLAASIRAARGSEEGGDGSGTEGDWSRDLMGRSWVSQVSAWAGMLPGSASSSWEHWRDSPVGNPFAGMPDPFAAVGVRNPFAAPERGAGASPSSR